MGTPLVELSERIWVVTKAKPLAHRAAAALLFEFLLVRWPHSRADDKQPLWGARSSTSDNAMNVKWRNVRCWACTEFSIQGYLTGDPHSNAAGGLIPAALLPIADHPSLKRLLTVRPVRVSVIGIANPYPVPTVWAWYPLPATAVTNSKSGGEDWEVVPKMMEVTKVVEVIKVREVVSWKERMTEWMYTSPCTTHAESAHAAEAMDATKALHAAEAVASKTPHRAGGQSHWSGKHRHHDSTSEHYFAEHNKSPDVTVAPYDCETSIRNAQMTKDLISDKAVKNTAARKQLWLSTRGLSGPKRIWANADRPSHRTIFACSGAFHLP
jgi:hypothetical protein